MAKNYLQPDPLALSVYRVLLGLMWIWLLLYRWTEIPAFYSNTGVLPLQDAMRLVGSHRFTLLSFFESDSWVYLVFSVGLIAGVFLTAGIKSNFSAFVAWVICISMINRNETIMSGGDMYMNAFLLVTVFLPVDGHLRFSKISHAPQNSAYFEFGKLFYLTQILGLYFFAGLLKNGSDWTSGDALNLIYRVNLTTRPAGSWLLNFPQLLKFITLTVPWFEMLALLVLLPFKKFRPARNIWVLAAFSMHLGILVTMEVFYLPYMCVIALVPLIPLQKIKGLTPLPSPKALSAAAAVFIVLFLINAHTTYRRFIPTPIFANIEKLRLDQNWNFYGPNPLTVNSWWHIEAGNWLQLKNSTTENPPENPIRLYATKDWAVFFLGLAHPDYHEKLLPVFADYLCREQHIPTVRIRYFESPVTTLGELPNTSLKRDFSHTCVN